MVTSNRLWLDHLKYALAARSSAASGPQNTSGTNRQNRQHTPFGSIVGFVGASGEALGARNFAAGDGALYGDALPGLPALRLPRCAPCTQAPRLALNAVREEVPLRHESAGMGGTHWQADDACRSLMLGGARWRSSNQGLTTPR